MIDIFFDGANYERMLDLNNDSLIKGFTTNPTLMKSEGITDYETFAKKILRTINSKPISFEVFADELEEMEYQAKTISSWGTNVYVKIPVTNTKGLSTAPIIKKLSDVGIKLNVTAIFTTDQIQNIIRILDNDANMILSIFAGRIADTGINPEKIIQESLKILNNFKNIKILWASTREVLNINQAEDLGCDIITITDDIYKKLNLKNKDLNQFSLETVKMFYDDGLASGFKIN